MSLFYDKEVCGYSSRWRIGWPLYLLNVMYRGVARGGKGTMPPKFIAYLVILCFWEAVSHTKYGCPLKVKRFAPKNFGLATPLCGTVSVFGWKTLKQRTSLITTHNSWEFTRIDNLRYTRIAMILHFCPSLLIRQEKIQNLTEDDIKRWKNLRLLLCALCMCCTGECSAKTLLNKLVDALPEVYQTFLYLLLLAKFQKEI